MKVWFIFDISLCSGEYTTAVPISAELFFDARSMSRSNLYDPSPYVPNAALEKTAKLHAMLDPDTYLSFLSTGAYGDNPRWKPLAPFAVLRMVAKIVGLRHTPYRISACLAVSKAKGVAQLVGNKKRPPSCGEDSIGSHPLSG